MLGRPAGRPTAIRFLEPVVAVSLSFHEYLPDGRSNSGARTYIGDSYVFAKE